MTIDELYVAMNQKMEMTIDELSVSMNLRFDQKIEKLSEAMNQRFDQTDAKIEGLTERVSALESDMKEVKTEIKEIKTNLAAVAAETRRNSVLLENIIPQKFAVAFDRMDIMIQNKVDRKPYSEMAEKVDIHGKAIEAHFDELNSLNHVIFTQNLDKLIVNMP